MGQTEYVNSEVRRAPPFAYECRQRDWDKPGTPACILDGKEDSSRLLQFLCFWIAIPLLIPPSTKFIMQVGDNPASDMALACLGDESWRGVLVKTGVFTDNDAQCGADAAVDGVLEAVEHILRVSLTQTA